MNNHFLKLHYTSGYDYILEEFKDEIDDRLWSKWVTLLPHTSEPKSFSEFKKDHKPKKKTNNTKFKNKIDDAFKNLEKREQVK